MSYQSEFSHEIEINGEWVEFFARVEFDYSPAQPQSWLEPGYDAECEITDVKIYDAQDNLTGYKVSEEKIKEWETYLLENNEFLDRDDFI